MKKVIIVGGGFAGLNAAKILGHEKDLQVTLIDKRNYHLFQPLLYQVAMAALSPADIASPIRSILSDFKNIEVIQSELKDIDKDQHKVMTSSGEYEFDYLILACGAQHTYFGQSKWEKHAPGLKTIEQATEIRRRVLSAFENAESEKDPSLKKQFLTFVIVGGGPTGVELAGAIGEMSRFTLARDFRNIDPKLTRIILIDGGKRILPTFPESLSSQATRNLEQLGVQVWTQSIVTKVDENGVEIGNERIESKTILWAAGVVASSISSKLGMPQDKFGRILVEQDLSIKGYAHIFVAGDQSHFAHQGNTPLPGVAPVAVQQGRFIAKTILGDLNQIPRKPFRYVNKGQMATIGRSKAIVQTAHLKFGGFFGWLTWLVIHIYYLTGFKNRIFVTLSWAWSYFSFRRGARLIVNKEWQFFPDPK